MAMYKADGKTCIYFGGVEDCYCNNAPDYPGNCLYECGVEPQNPALRCSYYKTAQAAADKFDEIIQRENAIFRYYGGSIPEGNMEFNSIQREKIAAIYGRFGRAYLGGINYYGAERVALTAETIYAEYTGQTVFDFEAAFAVPIADGALAEMIVRWNAVGQALSLNLINKITNRVDQLGGVNLIWS